MNPAVSISGGSAVVPDQAAKLVRDFIVSNAPAEQRWDLYLYCRQQGSWPEQISGHDPEKVAPWFATFEPLQNISSEFSPILLLHGEKDSGWRKSFHCPERA